MTTEKKIKQKLEEVKDPHIGLDVVSLGFLNQIDIDGDKVEIKVVLTSPACPMAQQITGQIKQSVEELEDVEEAKVELDTEEQWSPEDMSEEAQEKLGHLF